MKKLKTARDLVDQIERTRRRLKMSRYALANVVAGKTKDNPINTDRRLSRLVSKATVRVDLGFAITVCDALDIDLFAEAK